MRSGALRLCLAAAIALGPAQAPAQTPSLDPEVARGIRLVDEGDYDAAILTLDAAARRLAQQPGHSHALSQAYLYLGIAYLGKGHETSAKARFRDALAQVRDLDVTPDRFAPRVVELFEKAREEMGPVASRPPAGAPGATAPQEKKKGGSKALIFIGVGAAAAAGVAVAAGGGGSATPSGGGSPNLKLTSFPNEVVVKGGGREFLINVGGTGTLKAKLTWVQTGVLLGMYIVALANKPQVLADGGQTATNELQLSLPVTAQAYQISVTNSSGLGVQTDTTFTLQVEHP